MRVRSLSFALLAALPLAAVACGGDSLTLPSEGQPAAITLDGSGQNGRVGSTLDKPLTVRVTDSQGRAVAGAVVDFVLLEDGDGGQVNPASANTDADGQASATITLGSHVGDPAMSGEARVHVPDGVTPVSAPFTASALAADANGLVMASGDGQSAPVGSALPAPLVVQVQDAFGNAISGVTIQWSADGQGSVSEEQTVTDVNGNASVSRTLGPTAGQQTTTASAENLAGSPVTFTSTATAGSANRIEIVSGNNQTGAPGSALPQNLVVKLLDQDGNPIPNRAVSWVIGVGGGSPDPETSQTGGDGLASTRWILGPSPGTNTMNAVVSGVGSVTFTATASGTGTPTNLALTTQPPASVAVGATLTPGPVVQVRDGAGHDLAVPGVEVTVALTGGGGQLNGTTTVTTDANGRAAFNDLSITGASGTRRLIFAADGYRSVTSDKIDIQKASTTTTITGQDPATSDPDQPVTVSFSVTSTTPGTLTGTVQVKASDSEQCSAPVAQGNCQLVLHASGDRTLTATYSGDDNFAGSSATANHHVNEPAPPPNQAPVAQADAYATPAGTALVIGEPGVLENDSDPDGNQLTAQVVTQPTTGIVALNSDGSFTYFPGTGASGSQDSFTYAASDGTLTSAPVTVTISIQ